MAMSRSGGATSLTISPPIRTSPALARSRPAAIRRTVVFPDPEGPTRTRNSPSATSRSRSSTATVPPANALRRPRNSSSAISAAVPSRDQVPIPERALLRDPSLGRIVDVDDPEPLRVAPFPFEVVEQRPDVVAADVYSLGPRLLDGCDVRTQVCDAATVRDGTVVEPVLEGSAVLRDQQREVAVVSLDPQKQLRERFRYDRPLHRRQLRLLLDLPDAEDGTVAGGDEVRPVEVHAEEVERLRDRLEIAVLYCIERAGLALVELEHVGGIRTAQHGVEEPAVVVAVEPLGRGGILLGLRGAASDGQVEREPDPAGPPGCTEVAHHDSVRQQRMVRCPHSGSPVPQARRLDALRVPEEGGHPRLVVGDLVVDETVEAVEHEPCVLRIPLDDVTLRPTALVLESLRQIPVVERRERNDPSLAQTLGEAPVEVEPLHIRGPAPIRLHPRPRDGEPVSLDPELAHEVEVLAPAEVMLASRLAGGGARNIARAGREAVPDRLAAAVGPRGALDLERRGPGSPDERGWGPPRRRQSRRLRSWAGSGEPTPATQPLTAPCMIPPTICRPSTRKTSSRGRIEMKQPVRMSE